jgi:hypothetical protein
LSKLPAALFAGAQDCFGGLVPVVVLVPGTLRACWSSAYTAPPTLQEHTQQPGGFNPYAAALQAAYGQQQQGLTPVQSAQLRSFWDEIMQAGILIALGMDSNWLGYIFKLIILICGDQLCFVVICRYQLAPSSAKAAMHAMAV